MIRNNTHTRSIFQLLAVDFSMNTNRRYSFDYFIILFISFGSSFSSYLFIFGFHFFLFFAFLSFCFGSTLNTAILPCNFFIDSYILLVRFRLFFFFISHLNLYSLCVCVCTLWLHTSESSANDNFEFTK